MNHMPGYGGQERHWRPADAAPTPNVRTELARILEETRYMDNTGDSRADRDDIELLIETVRMLAILCPDDVRTQAEAIVTAWEEVWFGDEP